MANIAKQIIESFEDIGKDVVRETAKLPVEMLGMSKPKPASPMTASRGGPQTSERSKLPPREWLSELAGKNKQREPAVAERFEREKQEKQEKDAKKNAVEQKMAPLPRMSQKTKRGNLLGVQQSSEKSKNARQD